MNETQESQARQSIAETIRTHVPVSITSFDIKTQLCSVLILAKFRLYGEIIQAQELKDVPLAIKGDQSFFITVPMKIFPVPGYLVVMDRSIDNWFESGKTYDPKDKRTHDLSDSFVELGGRAKPMAIRDYNNNNIEIRSIDGKTKIEMTDNGKFNFRSPDDELLQILSDLVGHLIETKAVVSSGSSAGSWGTNKISYFSAIKQRIDKIKL